MKTVILAMVTVLAPLFAHADANTGGESTLKLSEVNESISVRAQVARKEVQAIDSEIRKINDEIDKLDMIEHPMHAMIHVGLPPRIVDAYATMKTGLEIERAQLMADRQAMMAEATVAAK